jgi:exodeoxyribonuclease V alpha subunit
MDTLQGSVERITYYNPENGYTVLRLRPERRGGTAGVRATSLSREGLATVVGNLPELSPGEHVQLQGRWVNHPRHGSQFNAEVCENTLPATASGIRRYLGSGLIKGIGPRLAERIVKKFGGESLEIIEHHPERLREVQDIGPKRTETIVRAWQEQRQVKEIMLFLHSHGVTTNLAVKIYKTYGDQSLAMVQQDPYALARDIFGVGFKTADRLAQDLGLPPDHPSRIEAGVIYTLNQMSAEGHVYSPQEELVQQTADLLVVDAGLVAPALERLAAADRIRPDRLPLDLQVNQGAASQAIPSGELRLAEDRVDYASPVIYLTPFYHGERGVSERLGALNYALPTRLSSLPPAFINLDRSLSEEQGGAIRTALSHPVSVLTGGPGTGKTTCLKALIQVLDGAGKRYALASPTGRAARRLSEATGRPASTIHRLLGFSPREGFKYNAENPLPVDFLVLDEASMLDLILANNLLKALQPGTHLLLVGDIDQLPSVGAGDVLRDVIASGTVPVTRLNTIFRQAAGSQIITNAHRINRGEMPLFSPGPEVGSRGDFYLFPGKDAEEAARWVLDVVINRVPKQFSFNPQRDIQVLAPMYRGAAGVQALNDCLQKEMNPLAAQKTEVRLFGTTFRTGDKVMQTENNYDKEVFNGDIGFIKTIDPVEHTMTVEIDQRHLEYDFTEVDQLVLAYAVTVHKAQGSEFPVVVMPLVTAHYLMLQRNLLYTAITRAEKLCVLVGSKKAIAIAVRNNKVAQRHTALDFRLKTYR